MAGYQNFYSPYPNMNYQNPYYQQQQVVTPGAVNTYATQQQAFVQPQYQQQYQLNSGFQWVQGEAAAKAYHVEPGQTILLMDSDNPVLYYKSTDSSGRPIPMIVYDLVERKQSATDSVEEKMNIDLSEYIRRDEIEEIILNAVAQSVDQKMSEIQFTATTAPATTTTRKSK